ncbi:MAG: hypothetical protein AB7X49_00420 [Geminicoccaceae bacterium]
MALGTMTGGAVGAIERLPFADQRSDVDRRTCGPARRATSGSCATDSASTGASGGRTSGRSPTATGGSISTGRSSATTGRSTCRRSRTGRRRRSTTAGAFTSGIEHEEANAFDDMVEDGLFDTGFTLQRAVEIGRGGPLIEVNDINQTLKAVFIIIVVGSGRRPILGGKFNPTSQGRFGGARIRRGSGALRRRAQNPCGRDTGSVGILNRPPKGVILLVRKEPGGTGRGSGIVIGSRQSDNVGRIVRWDQRVLSGLGRHGCRFGRGLRQYQMGHADQQRSPDS